MLNRYIQTLFIFFITTGLIGCGISEQEVDEWVIDGNIKKIEEYLKANLYSSKPKDIKLVDYTITKSVSSNLEGMSNFLDSIYFSKEIDPIVLQHKKVIIISIANQKRKFLKFDKLLDLYVEGIILGKKSIYSPHKGYIEQLFPTYGNPILIRERIFPIIISKLTTNQFVEANNILNSLQKIDVELTPEQDQIRKIADQIVIYFQEEKNSYRNYETVKKIDYEIDNLDKSYDNKLSILESKINDAQLTISNTFSKISELENSISRLEEEKDELDYFWLSGYIVAIVSERVSGNTYEIATGSRYRSLLTTFETSYNTKGYFSIRARKTGVKKVRVKEEFGGFEQEWNVYEEVIEHEVAMYDERVSSIRQKKKELSSLNREIAPTTKKIKVFNNEKEILILKKDRALDALINERERAIRDITQERDRQIFELKKLLVIFY
ncbi:MAG: hypothetical protein OZ930_08220 [Ignavibacteria bacterium]|nr:hypothetical protein [Ignavibacteria bacterium]